MSDQMRKISMPSDQMVEKTVRREEHQRQLAQWRREPIEEKSK